MQEKSLIKKNILQFLEKQNISKYQFYKETGITRGVLDQNNGMSEENTAKFLAYYTNINVEWLITGNGPIFKNEQDASEKGLSVGIVSEPENIYVPEKKDIVEAKNETIAILKQQNAELRADKEFFVNLINSKLLK